MKKKEYNILVFVGKEKRGMSRIILSEIAKNGVKNAKVVKSGTSKKYNKLVKEADDRIDAAHINYANVYKRAATYMSR